MRVTLVCALLVIASPGTASTTPFSDMLLDKVGQGRAWATDVQESALAACMEGKMTELTHLVARTGNFGKWRGNVGGPIYIYIYIPTGLELSQKKANLIL